MINFKKNKDYEFLKSPTFYNYGFNGYNKKLCNKNIKVICLYIILGASLIYLFFSKRSDSQSIVFAAVTLLYSLYLTELNRITDKYYNLNQYLEKIVVKKDKTIFIIKNDSNYDINISKFSIFDDENKEVDFFSYGFFPKNDIIELQIDKKIDLKKLKYRIEMEISNIVVCDKYIQYFIKNKNEYYIDKKYTFLTKTIYYKYTFKDVLFLLFLISYTLFQIIFLI